MEIGGKKFQVLLAVGKNPTLDKKELAEETDTDLNYVSSTINELRNYGLVLRTMRDEDREKGLRWELTGQGKRKIDEELEKLEKKLGLKIGKPTLHVYRPPHAR